MASNEYYDHSTSGHSITQGSIARSSQVNNIASAITTGLDKLPTTAELKQGVLTYGTDSGSADAYVVTMPYTSTLTDGTLVSFKAANANTGASTVNVDSLGVKSIVRNDGSACQAGDIPANKAINLRYNTTDTFYYITSGLASIATNTAADLVATNADVVTTNADVVLTNADVVLTNADVVTTNADVVLTNADVVTTNADAATTTQDAIDTAADAVSTAADAVSTAADAATTTADVASTNADVVTTNADVVLTNADVVTTNADVVLCDAAYDAFDDRYLGSKASDPTLDNDGDALAEGALYWDSVNDVMKAYTGSVWASITAEELVAISDTINANTVVASYIYIPSIHDHDPSWTTNSQHTSWYQETLDSATRGSTRPFPEVALIIAEADTVTIYDATDSTCPMWMVFNSNTTSAGGLGVFRQTAVYNVQEVKMLNGILYIAINSGSSNVNNGLHYFDFANDVCGKTTDNAAYTGQVTPITDYDSANITVNTVYPTITNDSVNAIAVTQDEVGGNIVFVGSDGGLDRIAPDGSVSSWTDDGGTEDLVLNVVIFDNYVYWSTDSTDAQRYILSQPTNQALVDSGQVDTAYQHYDGRIGITSQGATYQIFHDGVSSTTTNSLAKNAIATDLGLKLIKPNYTSGSQASALLCTITDTFTSGWQFGDIKGAWLADSVAETLSGTDLVTNGTFAADTDWTKGTGWTISAGVATCDGTQVAASNLTQTTPPTYVVGVTYVFTFEITAYTAGNVRLLVGADLATTGFKAATGTYMFTYKATSTSHSLDVKADTDFIGSIDNVTVTQADPDRSYNNNGLQTVGSVTKAAVETGAELMAYSGWSASNYLTQPYNSDLDFGTGDFYVMGWVKADGTANDIILTRQTDGDISSIGFVVQMDSTGDYIKVYFVNAGNDNLTSTKIDVTGIWVNFCVKRESSNTSLTINGVEDVTGTSSRDLTNTSGVLKIGLSQAGSTEFSGSIAMIRIGAGAPTAAQISTIYESERHLFRPNAEFSVSATDVTAIDYDSVTQTLIENTTSGWTKRGDGQIVKYASDTDTGTVISMEDDYIVRSS